MHGNPPWRSNPSIPYTSQKTPTHPKGGHNLSTSALKRLHPNLGVIEQCCCKVIKGQVIATGEGFLRTRLMFSDSSGDPWEKKTTALKIPESYGIVKLLIETIDVLLLCNFWVGKVQKETTSFVTCHFYYWYWLSDEEQPFFFQGNHIFVFLTAHLSLWLLQ